ncbi:MAG: PIN domain-containing protein [Planctomycetota bacterium]|nr:PIN domain-containing protein [Planctomycetota bacterium]
MTTVFADTFYFFALGNRHDSAHHKVVTFSRNYTGQLLTTGFVLTELADGCAGSAHRRAVAVQAVRELRNNSAVIIVPCSQELFYEGLDLFEQRPDKEWSLTDCISFVVMQRQGISEALTGDKHFEQAGFVALLR